MYGGSALESAARTCSCDGGRGLAHDPRDEPRAFGRVPSVHDRLADPGDSEQNGLDLADLDAMAADLQPRSLAPRVEEAAIRKHPPEVAGPVHPHARAARNRQERGGALRRILPVAHGERAPEDGDLALVCGRPPRLVEQDDLRLVDRVAERRCPGPGRVVIREPLADHVHLGRPEPDVEDTAARKAIPVQLEVGREHRLAAELHHAKGRQVLAAVERPGEAAEDARDRMKDGDALAREEFGKAPQPVARERVRTDRGPRQERAVDAGHGGAEARRRQQRQPVVGADRQSAGELEHVVQDVAVALHDALGRPGRAGSEEHVREVVGRNRGRRLRRRRSCVQLADRPDGLPRREAPRSVEPCLARDDGRRIERAQDRLEARGGQRRIQRYVEPAGLERAEHRRKERGSRVAHQGDGPGPARDPLGQAARDPAGGGGQLRVGRDAPRLAHGRAVREPLRDLPEASADRAFDLGTVERNVVRAGRHRERIPHFRPRRRSPGAACRTRRCPGRARAGPARRTSSPRTERTRRRPPSRSPT